MNQLNITVLNIAKIMRYRGENDNNDIDKRGGLNVQ